MSTAANDAAANCPQPEAKVLGGVVAYLQVRSATAASEFYQKAFGATELFRHPVDEKGRTMHIHLHINGTSVMLSDAYPEHGFPHQNPQAFTMMLPVDDIHKWWDRAVAAGAEVVKPVEKMFWGDLYGELRDPFGVLWSMDQPVR